MNETNITAIYVNYNLPKSLVFVIVAIQISIIVVAVCGNSLVCVAICVNKNLRETPSNYFLFSLAVSDILTATLSITFDVDQILKPNWRWDHGPIICKLWTKIYLIAVPTSILSLLAISVDRYKAISDPLNKFKRSPFLTRKRATLVVLGLWLYCIIFAFIPTMGWSLRPDQINIEQICVFNTPPIYSLLNSCLNFYLPLFIMVAIYFRIYRIASRMNTVLDERAKLSITNHSQERPLSATLTCLKPSPTHSTEGGRQTPLYSPDMCPVKNVKRQRRHFNRSVKTAKSILVIVCAFFFCWIPHTTVSVVTTVFCTSCYFAIPAPVYPFLMLLGYLNSALNPPLYSLHNPKFVEAFRKILRLKGGKSRRSLSNYSPSDTGLSTRIKSSLFLRSNRQSTSGSRIRGAKPAAKLEM